MASTRIKYDSCNRNTSYCNRNKNQYSYTMDLNRYENKKECNSNQNNNISYYQNSIGQRVDIENNLLVLNQKLGECNRNTISCGMNPNQSHCNVGTPAVKTLCDRSFCGNNFYSPNSCFGTNANLYCSK